MHRTMGLRRTGLTASVIAVGVIALSTLPAPAGAYMTTCAHVRGYDNGTVTVHDMTCRRAARILWQAREGHLNPQGFTARSNRLTQAEDSRSGSRASAAARVPAAAKPTDAPDLGRAPRAGRGRLSGEPDAE